VILPNVKPLTFYPHLVFQVASLYLRRNDLITGDRGGIEAATKTIQKAGCEEKKLPESMESMVII